MPLDDDARRRAAETKRQRTIDAITAAANQLLETGAARLTFKEVAKLAGVSVATVYRYYPTKEALVQALIQWHTDYENTVVISSWQDVAEWHATVLAQEVLMVSPDSAAVFRGVIKKLSADQQIDLHAVGMRLLDRLLDDKLAKHYERD